MKKELFKYNDKDLYLTVAKYSNNGRMYLGLDCDEGLYDDITINLTDMMLPSEDYAFINSDIGEDLKQLLVDKKIMSEPIDTMQYNMGRYDLVRLYHDVIKEYDPEGYEKNYLKDNDYEI